MKLAFLFYLLCTVMIGSGQTMSVNNIQKQNALICSGAFRLLRPGDIILRNGVGKESTLIKSFAISDSSYSHAGIALKDRAGKTWVFHIMGGFTNPKGNLLKESFESFTQFPENSSFGIFRLGLTKQHCARFLYFLDSLVKKKVVFDYSFDLTSKDSLYCTELIVEGLRFCSKGKIDLKPLSKNLSNTPARFYFRKNELQYYPIEILSNNTYMIKSYHFRYL